MRYIIDELDPILPTEEALNEKIEELEKRKKILIRKKNLYFAEYIGAILSGAIIITGIGVGVATKNGHCPFKKEDVKRIAYIKTDFDSEGKKEVSKQYEPYKDMSSKVTYYGEWTDVGDKYATVTTTYDVTGHTFEEVDGIVKIKDHPSGEPVEEIVFIEDASAKPSIHYEGTVYETNKNDYIITPQTKDENERDIIEGLILPALPGLFVSAVVYVYQKTGFDTTLDRYNRVSWAGERVDKEIEDNKKLILKIKNNKRVS